MWPNREGSCFQLEANKKKLPISGAEQCAAAYFYGMRNIAINLENERREEKREERTQNPLISRGNRSEGGGGERAIGIAADRPTDWAGFSAPFSLLNAPMALLLRKANRLLTGKHRPF